MKRGISYVSPPRCGVDRLPPDTHCHGFPVRFDPETKELAHAREFQRDIVVGKNWFRLTGEQQWATLLHEAGHLHHRHFWKRMLWLPLFFTKAADRFCQMQELEADEFVVAHGYGLAFLSLLARVAFKDEPFHPSGTFRMHHLSSKIMQWRREHEMAA